MQRTPERSAPTTVRRTRRPGRLAALLAAIGLVVTACSGGGSDSGASTTAPSTSADAPGGTTSSRPAGSSGTIKVMPLGDSITEGGDPSRPTDDPQSYRGYLYSSLVEAGYDVDFVGSNQTPAIGGDDPDNEGHGGYSIGPDDSTLCGGCPVANLDAYLEGWLAAAQPDVVLLMIGVNDFLSNDNSASGGGKRDTDPAEAGPKLEALVARIRALQPDATVVVASYPPTTYLVDPALDSHEDFAAFNATAKRLGDGRDDHVVYAPMAETFADSWTAEDVIYDQLHPSAKGAERIAEVWFDAVTPVLDARR